MDNLGHLGGLITGIIMGFVIAENDERRDRNQSCLEFFQRTNFKNKCGLIVLTVYIVLFLLIFYLVVDV